MKHKHCHCQEDDQCQRRHRSIFIRLLVIFILTTVVVNLLFGVFFLIKFSQGGGSRWFIGLILLVSLALVISHLFIRRILRPVHWMTHGVKEIRDGNLDYTIPVRPGDEFGHLTQAFNDMTKKIREMIRSRDQLLLDVSHELRSPITRMKVALEMIPEGKEKESIRQDLVDIETMLTEILETERLNDEFGKLNKEELDIVRLIKNVLKPYAQRAPGFELGTIPDTLKVCVDGERIKTVFNNVIDNAYKHTGSEGLPVRMTMDVQSGKIFIKIRDYGQGIPEKDLPFVFEPFYRVDQSRSKGTGGFGLGLSLCKKIMEAHQGDIRIENDPEGGVRVVLEIPLQDRDSD